LQKSFDAYARSRGAQLSGIEKFATPCERQEPLEELSRFEINMRSLALVHRKEAVWQVTDGR
jgi:hypothetical protein